MHEMLRRRILRRMETLPEAQLYQVLDYIEFLESRHGSGASPDPSGLQTLAERLEDGLRRRTLSPTTVREAFQLISVADRLLSSVSEAGREILADFQDEVGGGPPRRPEALPDAPPETSSDASADGGDAEAEPSDPRP